MRARLLIGSALIAAVLTTACVPPEDTDPTGQPTLPPPGEFGALVINEFFPLIPGTVYTYRGTIDGVRAKETLTVTQEVKLIAGVWANVLTDELYVEKEDGSGLFLEEYTLDWYATANDGTVWYLGEDTKEFDEAGNVVSSSGSFEHGVDGAQAGIYMPAVPVEGDIYKQELADDAQDVFKITHVEDGKIATREWNPLEPGAFTRKVFRSLQGMTLEDSIKGDEDLVLRLTKIERF